MLIGKPIPGRAGKMGQGYFSRHGIRVETVKYITNIQFLINTNAFIRVQSNLP